MLNTRKNVKANNKITMLTLTISKKKNTYINDQEKKNFKAIQHQQWLNFLICSNVFNFKHLLCACVFVDLWIIFFRVCSWSFSSSCAFFFVADYKAELYFKCSLCLCLRSIWRFFTLLSRSLDIFFLLYYFSMFPSMEFLCKM